ncbi:MAG: hypothetical protein KBT20_07090 [Bacteroidales bacterium]|nr:hypothetical protein [Candidatus Liminaster caballi]
MTVEDPASTVVNADGTVTFNYRNDLAKEVMVDVQFAGRHSMERDSVSGLWTVTLGPAAPDMYPYCFVVDGVSIMDPKCSQWFPNEGFKNSLLDIPGSDAPLIHSIQPVAHGDVEYVTYYSETIKAYSNALVYLPPSYAASDKSYPVFYLISGTTDTEEVYYKVGRMNYILDNLIAQGEAKEMIVVLPYGNPMKLVGSTDMLGSNDLFSEDLVGSLMPYVESHYRTANDRENRAIGGFSRGGNQALMNGLMNLDKFSYLCSYSSFTSTELPKVYDNAKATNSKINLFWTGVGTDDFLYGTARDYTEFLDRKGIRCVKEYTDDKFGHTWMNAKYFLAKTMRLLFNPEASAEAMKNAQPTKAKTGNEQQFTPGVMARLFPRPIVSPEFTTDGVTFRFKAPSAECVMLDGEMLNGPHKMERDSDGVWSVTLTDVTPDVYCYNFVVDDLQVVDPQNMYLAPDRGFKRSVLNMPDAPFSVNNARLNYSPVAYKAETTANGESRFYATVSPLGIDATSLPVVALVAGGNDTFESWYKIAHANLILDQMMAEGKCKPCVLYLVEQPMANAAVQLVSSDYMTWSDARKALVEALSNL